MTRHSRDLTSIAARTLAYYNQYARDFCDGTRTHRGFATGVTAATRDAEARRRTVQF